MDAENFDRPEREIRDALGRVLASPDFDASERNRRFLGFVVDEALSGREDWIKAYTIATGVFGRPETFDPQTDAIVRIEARRLRDSLERYYLKGGRHDTVRIAIPKGGYVPSFASTAVDLAVVRRPCDDGAMVAAAEMARPPAIFVAPFEEEGDQTGFRNVTRGIRRQLIASLSRFTSLRVFTLGDEPPPAKCPPADAGFDYVLSGGTSLAANRLSVEVLLTEAATGQCLWGDAQEQTFEADAIHAARDEIVGRIVRALAEPYGVILSHTLRASEGRPADALGPVACVSRFHQSWRTYDPAARATLRIGLERAAASAPTSTEACACLAMLLADEHRFDGDATRSVDATAARAQALALRAVELSPHASTAYRALGLARWFAGDVPASIAALETARRLNPNDTIAMAELGLRHAHLGNWLRAVPLLEAAFGRQPALPSSYRVALALFHYMHRNYEAALTEARRVDAPPVVHGAVLRAIAAAKLGRLDEVRQALRTIDELAPQYAQTVQADLARRNVDPDVAAAVVDGLAGAAMAIGFPLFGPGKHGGTTHGLRIVPPPSAG